MEAVVQHVSYLTVEMVSLTHLSVNNVILDFHSSHTTPPALLDVDYSAAMECWMQVKSAMMVEEIRISMSMAAEPIAGEHIVVMVFVIVMNCVMPVL